MVDSVKDYAILMLDPKGFVVTWNRGAEHIKGYSASEIIGQNFEKFYPPEDLEWGKPQYELREAIAKGRFEDKGWRVRKDGMRFWAEVIITPIYDQSGKLTGFSKVTRDMTDRRKAEQKFQDLLEAAPDAIVIMNQAGDVILVNSRTEGMFGYKRSELLGRKADLLLPPNSRGERLFDRGGCCTAAEVRPMTAAFELCGLRKDGTEFPIEVSLSPLETEDGTLVSSAIRDISERKQKDERYKILYNSIDEGCCTVEMIFTDEGKASDFLFLETNPAFSHQSGISDAVGKTMRELAPLHEDFWFESFGRIALTGVPERFQHFASQLNRYFDVYAFRVANSGTKLVSILFSDITERKRTEDLLRQKNIELEAAVNELDAFSYSVSHDLRSPLRAIDGFARILMKQYGPSLPLEPHGYLRLVSENAIQMGHLVDDLLEFSRIGRQSLRKTWVTTAAPVEKIVADLQEIAEGRSIRVSVGQLPRLWGDPRLIKQVFVNLIENAFKYTRLRSETVIQIGFQAIDGEQVFFVRDNGVGFDMRYAGKLFGVFQRLHRDEDFEGTGVGLAIVQRIVQRHGGRVWAEAAVDQGAAFFFTVETPG